MIKCGQLWDTQPLWAGRELAYAWMGGLHRWARAKCLLTLPSCRQAKS